MTTHKGNCPGCGYTNQGREPHCAVCGGNMGASYFDVLGLRPDASFESIQKAYRKAAARCHPDKTAHLSEELQKLAENKMKQLNYIWEILKTPEKRESYIRSLQYPPFHDPSEQDDSPSEPENSEPDHTASVYRAPAFRRGLARAIDYLLIGLLLFALIRFLVPTLLQWAQTDLLLGSHVILSLFTLVFVSLTTFLWVWLETFFIAQFATTPGKWLMRIRIVDAQRVPLNTAASLERALAVWFKGMAGGFLPLAPLVWIYWYRTSDEGETLPWDELAKSSVVVEQNSIFAYAASTIILLQSAGLLYLNWQELALAPAIRAKPSPSAATRPAPLKPAATTPFTPVAASPSEAAMEPGTPSASAAATPTQAQSAAAIAIQPSGPPSTPAATSIETNPTQEPVLGDSNPAAAHSAPLLPPPLQAKQAPAPASAEATPAEPAPAALQMANEQKPKPRAISEEQRVACMNRYFEIMHQATDLPLGDYVRLDREARVELERCLR